MPRGTRLDVPNVLHHVMARGIEGQDIFRDTRDCNEFLRRLSEVVTEGKVQLFAWCLMPNHFHLLVRPRVMLLSSIMRRLMTGYAVWHNRRHNRKGHLFQNRYKSIVIEEDPYFLELVRYIHLNPVRAGLVKESHELDRYPYTGHAVIMGYQAYSCQDVETVLGWFGNKVGRAHREYRSFVAAGFGQGSREDLRGGGLVRSAGGQDTFERRVKRKQQMRGDERILGSGSFVEEILGDVTQQEYQATRNVEDILEEVCKKWRISSEQVFSRTKVRKITRARREFFLRAHEEVGESIAALARLCGFAHTSVREAIERARKERGDG